MDLLGRKAQNETKKAMFFPLHSLFESRINLNGKNQLQTDILKNRLPSSVVSLKINKTLQIPYTVDTGLLFS